MIELKSIYTDSPPYVDQDTMDFLFDILGERDGTTNISHTKMPTYGEHIEYVLSKPHEEWWLILVDNLPVGSAYLSKQNEIGVCIKKGFQGCGFGPEAVEEIDKRYPTRTLYANINPENDRSKRMFSRLGFSPLQVTFVRRARASD